MSRNILATCPRVTRFRIDWNDSSSQEGSTGGMEVATENSENQPPSFNTESESNQMAIEIGGAGDSLKSAPEKDDSSLLSGNELVNGANPSTTEKLVVNGSADASNAVMGFPSKTESSGDGTAAMEM